MRAGLLAVACGGDVAAEDIAGSYTVTASDGPNACGFGAWTSGDSSAADVKIVEGADGAGAFIIDGLAHGSAQQSFAGTRQ
ncbi:MAG TPA: hypothetical protein VGH28_31915 [Polyangiaceae bacterium]